MSLLINVPLSLYIHIPWCIKKCPYCDFNSHCKENSNFSVDKYINALIADVTQSLPLIWGRKIKTIFIGGGTPSLFSPEAYEKLFGVLRSMLPFDSDLEVTMEANPGAIERGSFIGYKEAGINRVSLGVQSFSSIQLKKLGRVHSVDDIYKAVSDIKSANIKSFNLDIMYGLPGQIVDDAIKDIELSLELAPTHFSWYQLTIEPNTVFYKKRPILPKESEVLQMEKIGRSILSDHNFNRYEVSAYSKPSYKCLHNINYWKFGDYLGIGAGAHSKITDINHGVIKRYEKFKVPGKYISSNNKTSTIVNLSNCDKIFEFFLNRLRMDAVITVQEFEIATGIYFRSIEKKINNAVKRGLLYFDGVNMKKTKMGSEFLDDLVSIFLFDREKSIES